MKQKERKTINFIYFGLFGLIFLSLIISLISIYVDFSSLAENLGVVIYFFLGVVLVLKLKDYV